MTILELYIYTGFLLVVGFPLSAYLIAKGVTLGHWRALTQIEERNWKALKNRMDLMTKDQKEKFIKISKGEM